jgi:hypothetical protein
MVQQDMGMNAESSSIRAGAVVRVDRSTPWDRPGEWQSRRIAHLEGALRLLTRVVWGELGESDAALDTP